MQVVNINGEVRQGSGKSANKALRKEGKVPAVIYGGKENIHFTTTPKALKTLVYTPDFKLAEVEVDGQKYKTILKDIQFHPVSDEIVHVDFQELVPDHKVNVSVPVRFKGVSPGVKNGGKLIQSMRKVKIKVTPEQIVDELIADISKLELGSAIRVRDLIVGEGIEIMTTSATPLASVEVPRALKSADMEDGEDEADVAEGEEGAEGEAEA
jgi:large subunit ribosomal protein L25